MRRNRFDALLEFCKVSVQFLLRFYCLRYFLGACLVRFLQFLESFYTLLHDTFTFFYGNVFIRPADTPFVYNSYVTPHSRLLVAKLLPARVCFFYARWAGLHDLTPKHYLFGVGRQPVSEFRNRAIHLVGEIGCGHTQFRGGRKLVY